MSCRASKDSCLAYNVAEEKEEEGEEEEEGKKKKERGEGKEAKKK